MQPETPSTQNNWRVPLFLFLKISGWIGLPIVIALLLGKWLDRKFGTEPFLFLGLTGIAFIISLVAIVRESKKAMQILEDEARKTEHVEKNM